MKRRRTAPRKADVTDQALLDSLEQLLASGPMEAISVDRIAAGSGVTFYA